jgi:hypothetical protein
MWDMFGGCERLQSIYLGRTFTTPLVTDMGFMFNDNSSLTAIFTNNDFDLSFVTNDYKMFEGCTSLVGGQGTTYSSSYINKSRAHIDRGASNPGYFSPQAG